jgi:eukaryotic-like serine/threonine-protein kinase
MEEPAVDPLIGRTIADKFEIEAFLGGGSMGTVYRARHLALKRSIALKIMRVHGGTDPKYAKRFKREASTAFKLDHPNSMRVLDFGQEPDGILYMAMEYLEGRTLADVIADEWPLSADRISNILAQVLAALAVAHEMGIVHRDLKPENIMIVRSKDDDGVAQELVKVCDFGVAKLVEDEDEELGHGPVPDMRATTSNTTTLTKHGMTVGTPLYMAPEQALGQKTDARTDIYAAGVVLFQMLTKRLPFEALTPLQVMLKHIEAPAPKPSSFVPDVDPELERICLKALRKKPDSRYQSARAMRSKLRAMEEGSITLEVASRPSRAPGELLAPAEREMPTVRPPTTEPAAAMRPKPAKPFPTVAVLVAIAVAAGIAFAATR